MKKKRILLSVLCFLTAVLCLVSCASRRDRYGLPEAGKTVEYILAGIPEGCGVSGGLLYYSCEGAVRVLNLADGEDRVFAADAKDPSLIAADGGRVYVLTPDGIAVYDSSGTPEKTVSLPEECAGPVSMDCAGGTLCLTDGDALYTSEKGGAWRSVPLDPSVMGKVSRLCLDGNRVLLALSGTDGGLAAVDRNSGKTQILSERNCTTVCANRGKVFFLDGKSLLTFGKKDSVDLVSRLSRIPGDPDAAAVSGNTALAVCGDRAVLVPLAEASDVITVVYAERDPVTDPGYSYRAEVLKKAAEKIGAEVKIILSDGKTVERTYLDKVSTRMLAGDSSYDLLFAVGPHGEIEDFLSSASYYGQYVDLLGFPELAGNLSKMYPGAMDLLSRDGEIFGLPLDVIHFSYVWDASSGIDAPREGWTLDDLCALCDRLIEEGGKRQVFPVTSVPEGWGAFLLPHYIPAFLLTGAIQERYDLLGDSVPVGIREDMTAVLSRLKPYIDAGVLYGEDSVIRYLGVMSDFAGWQTDLEQKGYYDKERWIPVDFPLADAGAKTRAVVTGAVLMNPNSKKQELAAALLTELTGVDCRGDLRFYREPLWPGCETWRDESRPFGYMRICPDTVRWWDEHLAPWFERRELARVNFFSTRCLEALESFMSGALTTEDAADILYDEIVYAKRG